MRRIDTDIPGVCLIEPVVHGDHRGFFMESYHKDRFAELGIEHDFVQDNHSRSRAGVLRGLHYQLGRPQAKLVRATRGRVFDVVVDLRRGSPTFGRWVGAELSEDNRRMLFAPAGIRARIPGPVRDRRVPVQVFGFLRSRRRTRNPVGRSIHRHRLAARTGSSPILSDRDLAWPHLADVVDEDLPRSRS